MLKRTLLKLLLFLQVTLLAVSQSQAQCTTANLNWDNLEYLTTAGNYSGFVTNAMALTQNFAFGSNRLTMAVSNHGTNPWTQNGENINHTGEASSFGTGADVEFITTTSAARTITLTFDAEVSTFRLSLYDIDNNQRVTVTATNALGLPQIVTLSRPGTVVLALNPGLAPIGTGNGSNSANNSINGTLNIAVAGPVKTIVLSFSNAAGDFWLSDMSACVTASFPATYYLISRPFTGQPGYVLTVVNNNFYYTNTANGVSRFLFNEPASAYVNSVGYDPYNRFVYYTYSLTGSPGTDKALKKYDANTRTISTVLADITTLGIPVFEYGIESGSAGFYNGSLFLGIEGYNNSFNSGRKAMVWRIDFNGSNVPYRASQVYASVADDGGGNIRHDWSDIGLSNGILYDFDGASGDEDFFVYNMQTGAVTNYTPSGSIVGRQVAVGWDERLYNVETGTITQYNGTNGHTGSTFTITSTPAIPGGGSWGDAGEAFRPFVDYGDAPATYDPTGIDPAVHDSSSTTLRIGAAFNTEGAKRGVTSAEDTYDDGLSTVPFLPSGAGAYLAQVSVFNNTGANATLNAWLDYNGNGVFNTGEGITQVVASSASPQLRYLYWPSITVPMPNGSSTYLRIRITSTANGMTTANPTGYFSNGEVEDYRIIVDNFPLALNMLSFEAKAINNNKVKLNWSANEEPGFTTYDIERSSNGTDWSHFAFVDASHSTGTKNYEHIDYHPFKEISYYRLKLGEDNGVTKYSAIRQVTIKDLLSFVSITPNPASDHATVNIYSMDAQATAVIKVLDMRGNEIFSLKTVLRQGNNPVNLPIKSSWSDGMYMVQVGKGEEIVNKKLIIKR